jgi:GH18 family chitinase
MGLSSDYPDVPDWVEKPEGYQTGEVVKYDGNVFRAAFWASEPGKGDDPNKNGWRLFDELYDKTGQAKTEQAKIIAYIPTWRRSEGFDYGNTDMYRYLTHGIISFLTFNETDLGQFDGNSVSEVTAVMPKIVEAAHASSTKIMVALGGANDYGFLNLMTAAGGNANLLDPAVDNVVGFVNANNLDGVDLDLECWWGKPGDKDQGGRAKADGPHPAGLALTEFAKRLKDKMPEKIISATTFGTSWYGNNYDPKIADHVEWLAVMTYDLTGSWDASPVGPHTATHIIRAKSTESVKKSDVYQETYLDEQQGAWPGGGPENNPILSVEETLWYWTNKYFSNWQGAGQNLDRGKIAAGVPVYGYDFAHGKDPDDVTGLIPSGYKSVRYKDILKDFPNANTAKNANIKVEGSTPRPKLATPLPPGNYSYQHNLYFETPDTAVEKLDFLKGIGAQGVIIWELSDDVWDDGKSIVKALYAASGNPAKPPVSLPDTDPVEELPGRYLWDSTGFLGASESDFQFKDDGIKHDNVRQFSARLWNIPDGEDWKTAANRAPAVVKRQFFNRPTRVFDKGALGIWGEFDVIEENDVPAWYWGHMEEADSSPAGFKRYVSRLWGLPTFGGDWVASAKATPALVEGQYFNEPSDYDDKGIGGFYGYFDVPLESDGVPPRVIQADGDHGCAYCEIKDIAPPGENVKRLNLVSVMNVKEGTPFLYATLTQANDTTDFPDGVVMTIQDPDGNIYNRDIEDDEKQAATSGPSIRAMIVKNPKPGDWTMFMTVPAGTGFHCECNTVPSDDVFDTMVNTHNELAKLGLVPRDTTGALAFLAIAVCAFVFPPAGPLVSLAIITTAVGLAAFELTDKPAVAQNMAEVAGILNKVAKDVRAEGFQAIGKYAWLLGKNISSDEIAVILKYPQNLFQWLGIHRRVFQAVEHMTDAEEQNAVRHVYWQCLLKKRLGEDFARAMGDAHERGRPGSDADNKADEINNVKGLALADQVADETECLARAQEMWKNGELATRQDLEGDPT